jgi:TRAP-type C4-dicarboxylate transport system substrate-binding protein
LILAVSKETWNTFDAKDQAIIHKAALEAADWQKKAAREGLAGSSKSLNILKQNGMDVYVLTAEDVKAFKDKVKPVYDRWVPEIGADLVKAAEKVVQSTEKKAPAKRSSPKNK